jgi:hypothetical protein
MITDEESMIDYTKAFTNKDIDPDNNYEFFEILGDVSTNHAMVY